MISFLKQTIDFDLLESGSCVSWMLNHQEANVLSFYIQQGFTK